MCAVACGEAGESIIECGGGARSPIDCGETAPGGSLVKCGGGDPISKSTSSAGCASFRIRRFFVGRLLKFSSSSDELDRSLTSIPAITYWFRFLFWSIVNMHLITLNTTKLVLKRRTACTVFMLGIFCCSVYV